jgi:hypothetical protein
MVTVDKIKKEARLWVTAGAKECMDDTMIREALQEKGGDVA